MNRWKKWLAGGTVAGMVIVAGAGIAGATSGDTEQPLRGSALDRATAAALAHTGGGTVIDSEIGDGGAAYAVEIRLANGRVVEVSLDAGFNVIGEETDEDSAGESNASDER